MINTWDVVMIIVYYFILIYYWQASTWYRYLYLYSCTGTEVPVGGRDPYVEIYSYR